GSLLYGECLPDTLCINLWCNFCFLLYCGLADFSSDLLAALLFSGFGGSRLGLAVLQVPSCDTSQNPVTPVGLLLLGSFHCDWSSFCGSLAILVAFTLVVALFGGLRRGGFGFSSVCL